MRGKRIIIWSIFGFCMLGFFLILRPIPTDQAEEEQLTASGKVVAIYEAGEKDIVFQIADTDQRFYINRGLERGLSLGLLRATLMDQEVRFTYPQYWTPLDPRNDDRHVTKVEFGEEVIYDELP